MLGSPLIIAEIRMLFIIIANKGFASVFHRFDGVGLAGKYQVAGSQSD